MTTRFPARLGLAALLLAPAALPAQRAFEGTVTYRMTAEGMTMIMTQMTKGSKVRTEMEMPGMPGPMYVLMDMDSEVMQTVLPSMGIYMEMNLKQIADQVTMTPEMREAMKQSPEIERLGTTDRIAGITCHNYRFTQGTEQMEGCIATGMGFFMGGAGGGPPGQGGPLAGLGVDFSKLMAEFKDGMMPLRMRMKQNGTWSTVMEATAVERKSLDDSLFALPSGLRKMDMPGG
ncbi:MAG TPA: DUF4412 domain-containing protein [Gemmatimonadales bacterium]|nr:DUF4412 domain-containing protein [Gemmatimonadales bacterium]